MGLIATPTVFSPATTILSAPVNANFSSIVTTVNTYAVFKDLAATLTKTLTLTPDAGAALTVTTGGITVTAGGLTVAAGGVSLTTGDLAITAGNLSFAGASSKIIAGATSLLFRNAADSATTLTIADNGDVTAGGALTATSLTIPTVTLSTGIAFSGASGTVTIGTGSVAFKNNHLTQTQIDPGATNLALGKEAMGTADTTGHLLIPSTVGTPSGALSLSGHVALLYDRSNNRLNVYVPSVGWLESPVFA